MLYITIPLYNVFVSQLNVYHNTIIPFTHFLLYDQVRSSCETIIFHPTPVVRQFLYTISGCETALYLGFGCETALIFGFGRVYGSYRTGHIAVLMFPTTITAHSLFRTILHHLFYTFNSSGQIVCLGNLTVLVLIQLWSFLTSLGWQQANFHQTNFILLPVLVQPLFYPFQISFLTFVAVLLTFNTVLETFYTDLVQQRS